MSGAMADEPHRLKSVGLMITAKKNAPSLTTWGKSTFSEGGGDKRCVQKSTHVRNCKGVFVASQQVDGVQVQKLVKLMTFKTPPTPLPLQG
jgi:hypothetical protein